MQYKTQIVPHLVAEHLFQIECLENLDLAVDEMFKELEKRGSQELLEELCPYFGVVWPAAQALAEWLTALPHSALTQKAFLEVGCGLALPSLVASRLGAKVVATDLHPDVEFFLDRNLALNPNESVAFRALDWRKVGTSEPQWDWIVASDVLYEREYASSLLEFLQNHLRPGGTAVVSDPQRPFCERFEKLLSESFFRVEKYLRPVKGLPHPCALFVLSKGLP